MPQYPVPTHKWVSIIEAPLYGQVLPAECSDEELAAMLAGVERITTEIEPLVGWVIDASNIMKATPRQRQMYAECTERLRTHDARKSVGAAIVCASRVTRGIVTAVHWLTPPVYPFKIFADWLEGERWARQQLILRGIPISPEPKPLPATDLGIPG